jgi:hypothetical protein
MGGQGTFDSHGLVSHQDHQRYFDSRRNQKTPKENEAALVTGTEFPFLFFPSRFLEATAASKSGLVGLNHSGI